ncbi:MAG: ATP-binding protein [bacterium]
MDKLLQYLYWWFDFQLPKFVPRKYANEIFNTKSIPVFVGPRRSGKSTLFFQIISDLKNKIPQQNILYINFEDDRLAPLEGNELSEVIDTYRQHFEPDQNLPVYLFIDEIQNVPGWEKTIRRLHDTESGLKLMITGSNSKMLSTDIASALRGRTLTFSDFPLNFVEFLKFKEMRIPEKKTLRYTNDKKNRMLNVFQEYMFFGGFPEVVLETHPDMKEKLLQEYLRTIFFADIVERYEIRAVKLMDAFLKILSRQMSSLFSMGKMVDNLKSIGFKVSKNTLIDYFGYIEDALLGSAVSIYSYSVKDPLQYPKKFYLVDNGLFRVTSFLRREDNGRLLENLVFSHLKQQYEEIFYWKGPNGYEVDFVIPRLFKQNTLPSLLHVCFDLNDEKTKKREIRALKKAAKEFGVSKALIITRDFWGQERIDDLQIIIQPFIDWAV